MRNHPPNKSNNSRSGKEIAKHFVYFVKSFHTLNYWLSKRFFNRPTSFQSLPQIFLRDSFHSSPSVNTSRFSINCKSSTAVDFGSGKSSIYTPSPLQSFVDNQSSQIKIMRPVRETFSYTSKSYQMPISFISRLFGNSRPSTIFWRVISQAIISLNLGIFLSKFTNMLNIGLIHIISKIQKRFPSLTDFYTFRSILLVSFRTRIGASFLDTSPDTKESRIRKSMFNIIPHITSLPYPLY